MVNENDLLGTERNVSGKKGKCDTPSSTSIDHSWFHGLIMNDNDNWNVPKSYQYDHCSAGFFLQKRNVQTFLQNSPATHGMQITIPISTSLTIFFPVVCLRCKMKYYTQYLPNPFYWSIVDKCHYSILLIGKWGVWSQNNMYIYTANIRTNRHPDTAWMDWVRVWATGEWGRVVNSCSIYMCVCRAALFSTSTRIHGIHIVYQSINESLKEMYWMMHKTYKRIQSRVLRGRVPSVHVHAG